MMSNDTRRALAAVVERAVARRGVGCPDSMAIEGTLRRGMPVPDRLLPGRMVMARAPGERAALSRLTSDDVARVRPIPWA